MVYTFIVFQIQVKIQVPQKGRIEATQDTHTKKIIYLSIYFMIIGWLIILFYAGALNAKEALYH